MLSSSAEVEAPPGVQVRLLLLNKVESLYASQEEKGDSVPEPSWPENGDQWSDGEMEDSGLIQEMVEEDEEIDLYNEETFGLGQVAFLFLTHVWIFNIQPWILQDFLSEVTTQATYQTIFSSGFVEKLGGIWSGLRESYI